MNYTFNGYITGDEIESLNKLIDKNNCTEITININELLGSKLFANSRLLAFMVKCQNNNIKVNLFTKTFKSRFFKRKRNEDIFLYSLTGHILSNYAYTVYDENGNNYLNLIRTKQKQYLNNTDRMENNNTNTHKKEIGNIQTGNEIAALYFKGYNKPINSKLFEYSRLPKMLNKFNYEIKNSFKSIGVKLSGSSRKFQSISYISSDIILETVQNIYDHAISDLRGNLISNFNFIYLKRLNLQSKYSAFTEREQRNLTPVINYINDLRSEMKNLYGSGVEYSLIEVSITDGGPGIPARLSDDIAIYDKSISKEKHYLEKALKEYTSSKKTSIDKAGFGLPKVINAIKKLKGIVIFRTGRLLEYVNYINDNHDLYELNKATRNYLPGTSINILFPNVIKHNIIQKSIFDEHS